MADTISVKRGSVLLLRVQSVTYPRFSPSQHDTTRRRLWGCLVTTVLAHLPNGGAGPGPAPLPRQDPGEPTLWRWNWDGSPCPTLTIESSINVQHAADACGVASWLCKAVQGCADDRAWIQDTNTARRHGYALAMPCEDKLWGTGDRGGSRPGTAVKPAGAKGALKGLLPSAQPKLQDYILQISRYLRPNDMKIVADNKYARGLLDNSW